MKAYKLIFLLLLSSQLFAQDSIPDAGFEQTDFWCDTAKRQYTVHNSQWLLGSSVYFFGIFEKTFFQQKPYEGKYTAFVKTNNQDGIGNYLYQTFPYSKRPVSFGCMASYTFKRGEVATNNFCIDIIFTRNSGQDTIAYTRKNGDYQFHRDTSSSTKPYYFAFPIQYRSNDTPENCTIRIWTSIPGSKSYPLNFVSIDALKFMDTLAYSHTLPDTFGNDPIKKDTTHTGMSLHTLSKTQTMFEVFPNPTDHILYINLKSEMLYHEGKQLFITDSEGKTVYMQSISNTNQLRINTTALAEGMYFINIKTAETIYTQKFVVRR